MFAHHPAIPAKPTKPGKRFLLGHVLRYLFHARATRLQRLHLARLDDAALRDIGLTRTLVNQEAARPFWDAPAHWRL